MATGKEATASYWQYFRSPFPKAAGFSAYRSPGLLVHLPVIFFFVWLGCWLTLGDVWLYPLFPVLLVIGVYLGRDIAIFAHYNPLITLGVMGGGIALLNTASLPPPLGLPASATVAAAIAALFAVYVRWYNNLGN